MQPSGRPQPVGAYDLLQDFACDEASVRVIELNTMATRVMPHKHEHCAQIYVALEGSTVVSVDGVETILHPYETRRVPAHSAHSAWPAGDAPSVIMNISVPPLRADDQSPLSPADTGATPG